MKKGISQIVNILIMVLVGGFFGYSLGTTLGERTLTGIVVFQLIFFSILWFVVQLVIHEAGHAICGKLSGHKLVSFRIFSFMWVWQDNGKIVFRRHKVPGTLGQCLMAPPPTDISGNYPFRLYLIGGVLANLVTSLIIGIFFVPASLSATIFVIVGLFFALTNGIPMGFNDGMTIRLASLSKEQEYLLYLQFEVNYQFNLGKTYVELSSDYFQSIPAVPRRTYFNDYQEFLQLGLFFEEKRWEEYEELLEAMWDREEELVLPYQLEMRKALLIWLCVCAPEDERIEELWMDKKIQTNLKQPFMGTRAISAAYYGFIEEDFEKAMAFLEEGKSFYDKAPNLASAKLGLAELEWLEELLVQFFDEDSIAVLDIVE
ncbi:hypothetical protein [Enterococcus sp. BWR-S5]|uniref:hypothetical protein n=1 Tax=Enterococcus sp. BWR-S5 TaxID=2787714 RepID=UPI0019217434|nr:hypothetical protein [Enterococcus sp. BWR-S5]MBL1226901.1 hypothetical protein [Enterococcus sp. BWR-S5]